MARLSYLELPVADTGVARAFYAAAFGWTFAPFEPSYASTMGGDTDVGLQSDPAERSAAPLPVIAVDDLGATMMAVEKVGVITKAIFAFPGGRRFHFKDPDGHELAAMRLDS